MKKKVTKYIENPHIEKLDILSNEIMRKNSVWCGQCDTGYIWNSKENYFSLYIELQKWNCSSALESVNYYRD